MKNSAERVLTTHAGSLPRPDDLIGMNRSRASGDRRDEERFQARLSAAVSELVAREREVGVDVPNDGEFGKSMGHKIDYGAWWTYSFQRLGGLELGDTDLFDMPARRSTPGHIVLSSFGDRRDRLQFAEAYNDETSGITTGPVPRDFPVCTGPLRYTGQEAIRSDIANFTAALSASGIEEGFMTSLSPGSCSRIQNTYYASEDEFMYACADAMREEYQAIIDAGLVLQIDDPSIAENFDQINPEPSVEDYRRFTMKRVEALNYALRGLPTERIRFHLCWGSWHGPHVTDIPMADIVDLMLTINAGAYCFEAGNVRHEHEWKVWRDVKLPEGKILMPGVVSHATNVVEHPELVADRIVNFASLVGRENVVASTDCGLGGRIHPQLAWAKLAALARGAELATRRLWN